MTSTSLYRPLIAVPTAELPGTTAGEPPLWAMRKSYLSPLLAKQAVPVLLPQIEDLAELGELRSHFDGLLLADGQDINPALYHAPSEDNLEALDTARDRTEFELLQWALAEHLPILAISRGLQIVNVVAGGTLHQDIPTDLNLPTEHRQEPVGYANLAHHGHLITIDASSRLATLVSHPEIWVNSMHHQAVKKLGRGLKVVARSADQVVEAIEAVAADHWLVGLQFHPEVVAREEPWVKRLFLAFIQAARDYHGQHHDGV